MTTHLFYTDFEVSEAEYRAEKARLTPFPYHDLDDALGMARRIASNGGVPWEIETESRVLDRIEIMELVRQRGSALNNRPKVW